MKTIAFIIIVISLVLTQVTAFCTENKSKDKAQNTAADYKFGKVVMRIKQIKNRPNEYCSAWLEILKNGKILHKRKYIDIEPLGGDFGLFVPNKQPTDKYFMINKYGDYDGRTLLIDKDGNLFDLPGGLCFITNDNRYLFIEHEMDGEGAIRVFDINIGKVVFGNESDDEFYNRFTGYDSFDYSRKNDDVYVIFNYNDGKNKVYKYNFSTNNLVVDSTVKINDKDKLDLRIEADEYDDCNCNKTAK